MKIIIPLIVCATTEVEVEVDEETFDFRFPEDALEQAISKVDEAPDWEIDCEVFEQKYGKHQ